MKSYQQLFAELKRRHVFRVAAVYGAGAFVLLQVVDLLAEGLQLPAAFLTMVTILVLAGFPIALVVAWAFELTPEGVKRTGAASAAELERIAAEPASRRWPAGILALLGVAALVAGAWWVGRQSAPEPGMVGADAAGSPGLSGPRPSELELRGDARPSIAILRFADLSAEGDQAYFSDGMTEEIANTLAGIPELVIKARTSVFQFADAGRTPEEIGDELRVRYVVMGSVRKAGDQLRISARLVDTRDGRQVWTEQYDRTLDDVFAIQSEIAAAIAESLQVPLGLADPNELVAPVSDFDAYDLYLAGRARLRERAFSLNEAVRLFEAAVVASDSGWAPAWAGLAEAIEIRLWYPEPWGGFDQYPDSSEVASHLARAEAAARRALALDSESSSAHVALGNVLRDRYEWAEAEAAYRNALAIDPDNPEAHQQYAEMLEGQGRVAEAVRAADRAAALDPAPVRLNVLGGALLTDGRPAEARRAFERGILLDPEVSFPSVRGNLGGLAYEQERYDEAEALWAIVNPEWEDFREDFRQWVRWLESGRLSSFPDTMRRYLEPSDWMKLGYPDSAAAALARGYEGGLQYPALYRTWEPQFDAIRSHPAVQAYYRARNLAGAVSRRTPVDQREIPVVLRDAAE